jgi:MazG family protein
MPERLFKLLDRLRHPQDGCPWDKEQTPRTLCSGLVDETFELVDALENQGSAQAAEELGDLLFQMLFVIHIYAQRGEFGLEEVIRGIEGKMINRHPHVFGSERLSSSQQVLERWEEIKLQEGKTGHPLDSIPLSMPALAQAKRLWSKAGRLGLVEDKPLGEEELKALLARALDKPEQDNGQRLADFLFQLAGWAGRHHLDSEGLLRAANRKFRDKIKNKGENC